MKEKFLCVFELCNNIEMKSVLFNYLVLPRRLTVRVKYDFCIANIRRELKTKKKK